LGSGEHEDTEDPQSSASKEQQDDAHKERHGSVPERGYEKSDSTTR